MNDSNRLPVVLSIVDPRNGESNILEDSERHCENPLGAALDLAKRNGLGYVFLQRMRSLGLDLSPENERELTEAKRRISNIQRTIVLLNEVSRDNGIDYVVVKMPRMMPHIPRDIDVFVSTDARDEMIKALTSNGMRSEHSSNVETTLRKENLTKVDIYSRICYFGFDFLDDDFFSESRTDCSLFNIRCPVLDNGADFLLQLVHCLFGHRSMTLLDFLDLKLLGEETGVVERSRNAAREYGWGSTFNLALDRWRTLHERVYGKKEAVDFPYMFDRKFVFGCISAIDGLALNRSKRAFIGFSLFLDELVLKSQDSTLYEALRANELIRKTFNTMAHSARGLRGDRKRAD